jgi:hypothetical protein
MPSLRVSQNGVTAGRAVREFFSKSQRAANDLKQGREVSHETRNNANMTVGKLAQLLRRPQRSPWYYIAVAMSGISTMCAWRMVSEKNKYQVSGPILVLHSLRVLQLGTSTCTRRKIVGHESPLDRTVP